MNRKPRMAGLLAFAGWSASWATPADATSLREVYAATNAAVVTVFTREAFVLVDEIARITRIEHEAAGVIISDEGHVLGEFFATDAHSSLAATIGGVPLLLGGDIVLAIQGISLTDKEGYSKARARLSGLKASDTVTMTVVREGEIVELSALVPPQTP